MKTYGYELLLNLYDCAPEKIRSATALREYVTKLCKLIKMKKYGNVHLSHFGHANPHTSGYSLFQFIETSSIVGHFSEAWNAAYIDIFSCKKFDPKVVVDFSRNFFAAKQIKTKFIKR